MGWKAEGCSSYSKRVPGAPQGAAELHREVGDPGVVGAHLGVGVGEVAYHLAEEGAVVGAYRRTSGAEEGAGVHLEVQG